MFSHTKIALATGLFGLAVLGGIAVAETPTTNQTPSPANQQTPAPVPPQPQVITMPPVALPPPVPAAAVASNGTVLPSLTQLIKQGSPAVVNISIEGRAKEGMSGLPEGMEIPPELERFFRNMPEFRGDNDGGGNGGSSKHATAMGSGFIISQDGYIITNAHVVDNASNVTVTLNDQRELPAEIIGADKLSDIALLKIKADKLPTVDLGDSDKLEVGQWVFAIGAPFGLDHTATQGIVSALSRSLPNETYVPFIQTDVAVNPGNSGGPLFDLNGRVVGVNSQIYSRSGGYMGISFAVPVNVAKNVVEQLKTKGQVSRGWLGVGIQNVTQELAESLKLTQHEGALVGSVEPDSPADKGGIQAGDVIVNFANSPVHNASDLPLLVGNTPVGTKVPVKVIRAGADKMVEVTIDKLAEKDKSGKSHASAAQGPVESGSLGLVVSELSEADRKAKNLKDQGVMIDEVRPNSAADSAGLNEGNIILSVNGVTIHNAAELRTAVQAAPSGKPIAMLIMQNNDTRFVAVTKP